MVKSKGGKGNNSKKAPVKHKKTKESSGTMKAITGNGKNEKTEDKKEEEIVNDIPKAAEDDSKKIKLDEFCKKMQEQEKQFQELQALKEEVMATHEQEQKDTNSDLRENYNELEALRNKVKLYQKNNGNLKSKLDAKFKHVNLLYKEIYLLKQEKHINQQKLKRIGQRHDEYCNLACDCYNRINNYGNGYNNYGNGYNNY